MSISRLSLILALAYLLGLAVGHFGSAAQHRLESQTIYPPHETALDSSLGLAALPGSIIAEWQAGYDWRWDEAWQFRTSVRHWNAFFYSAIAFAVAVPFAARHVSRRIASSRRGITQSYDY